MTRPARLLLMIAVIVTATNLIVYYHLRLKPDDLTLPNAILISAATMVPITLVVSVWHRRGRF